MTLALLFPTLGPMELVLILVIVVVLFGASRFGEIGKGLGEGIKNFKKGISEEEPPPSEPERPRPAPPVPSAGRSAPRPSLPAGGLDRARRRCDTPRPSE